MPYFERQDPHRVRNQLNPLKSARNRFNFDYGSVCFDNYSVNVEVFISCNSNIDHPLSILGTVELLQLLIVVMNLIFNRNNKIAAIITMICERVFAINWDI